MDLKGSMDVLWQDWGLEYIVNKILKSTFTSDYTVNNANWTTRIIFYKNPIVSF
jgi:hypothetical protein